MDLETKANSHPRWIGICPELSVYEFPYISMASCFIRDEYQFVTGEKAFGDLMFFYWSQGLLLQARFQNSEMQFRSNRLVRHYAHKPQRYTHPVLWLSGLVLAQFAFDLDFTVVRHHSEIIRRSADPDQSIAHVVLTKWKESFKWGEPFCCLSGAGGPTQDQNFDSSPWVSISGDFFRIANISFGQNRPELYRVASERWDVQQALALLSLLVTVFFTQKLTPGAALTVAMVLPTSLFSFTLAL